AGHKELCMIVNWKWVLGAVLALMLVGVAASAQTASATLSGTVRDETGAVVVGASVTLRNPLTGASRSVRTDDEGRYSLTNIEPGEYELRAERSGFKTDVQSGVLLAVGGTTVVEISMGVGQVTEEVLVPQLELLIEPTKVEVSRVVASVEIESLPISGR